MINPEPPEEMDVLDRSRAARKGLSDVFAGWLESKTGLKTTGRDLTDRASKVDLSDGKAVGKMYQELSAYNQAYANKWLTERKPILDYHRELQKGGKMTDFDKKIALWQQNPDLFKQMKEAGVIGGGGVNVTVGGKETGFDVNTKFKISDDWRKSVKKESQRQFSIDGIKGLIQQAKEGNPAAYNSMQSQFAQLVGDTRINEGEIKRLNSLGSYGQRIIDNIKRFTDGVPTAENIGYFEEVVDYLDEQNWKQLDKKRQNTIKSYLAIYPSSKPEEKKRLLEMLTPIVDIGQNPATVGARKQKNIVRQLCTQLKKASDSGDNETAGKISAALKNAGITSCKG